MRKVRLMSRSVIRQTACKLALLFALAAPLATAATAQSGLPALRASVTVTGDIVRIGDLVENAGAVADVPIFRSPDLGTRGAVATDRIVEAIRPHQLIDIDTRGLSEVMVTRASRAITVQDITDRIAQALAGQRGLDAHNIAVTFDRDVRPLQVEATATGELQVLNLSYDPRFGRFDVTFDLPSSALLHRQPLRLTGTAVETINAVSVGHPIAQGEVLQMSDLSVVRRPKSEGPAITDMNAVAGLAARHELRPGQSLHDADLMKPEVVKRGEAVTLVYEAPGVVLTLRGQAQDSGALGDSVGVLNTDSKRLVQGVIVAPGRVKVSFPPTRFVDNAPKLARSPSELPPERLE
jgi:flagellar basal body P-ring formation protein FlgA